MVPEFPPPGSDQETICHVAAENPSWTDKRVAAFVGRHPSFVCRTIQRYGRRLRAERVSISLGLSAEQRRVITKAADRRGIRFDEMVERLMIVLANEPSLIDNVLDDGGAA